MKLVKIVAIGLIISVGVVLFITWNSSSDTPQQVIVTNQPESEYIGERASRADDSTYAEELKTLTALLNKQTREQNEEINALRQELKEKGNNIETKKEIESLQSKLNETTAKLNAAVTSLSKEASEKFNSLLLQKEEKKDIKDTEDSKENSLEKAANFVKNEYEKTRSDLSKSILDRKPQETPKITISAPTNSDQFKSPIQPKGNNFTTGIFGDSNMTPDGYLAIRPFNTEDPTKSGKSGNSFFGGFADGISNITAPNLTVDPKSDNPFRTTLSTGSVEQKVEPIPVYTIPTTATLVDNTTLSPLIGVVPDLKNNVNDPFRFRIMTGSDNLATNGIYINGVENIVWSGYVIGVRDQSCVRAYVDTVTYTFEDGRINTFAKGRNSSAGSGSNAFSGMNALGYLTDQYGKPCIRGDYISNAEKYLADRSMAAFLGGIADATSQSQMRYLENKDGDLSGFVTGNTGKYIAGAGIAGTAEEIAQYVADRAAGAMDLIYVDSGINVQLFVEEQIPIDYNPEGRKVNYEYFEQ